MSDGLGVWETGDDGSGNAIVKRFWDGKATHCVYLETTETQTSGAFISYLAAELFVGVKTKGEGLRTSQRALQPKYSSLGISEVGYLLRLNPANLSFRNASYLGGRNSIGERTRFEWRELKIFGDRVQVSAITGEDRGSSPDSLEPGRLCQDGSRRILELDYEFSEVIQATCL